MSCQDDKSIHTNIFCITLKIKSMTKIQYLDESIIDIGKKSHIYPVLAMVGRQSIQQGKYPLTPKNQSRKTVTGDMKCDRLYSGQFLSPGNTTQ